MVYMITESGRRTLKIGFTENLKGREQSYDTHNSGVLFIDVIDGTIEDETAWIHFIENMGWKRVKNKNGNLLEWFRIPKGVSKKALKAEGFSYFNR